MGPRVTPDVVHARLLRAGQAALDQMAGALVMDSKIAQLGIPLGKSPVNWSRFAFKAIAVKDIYGRQMITMLQNGLDVSHLVTRQFDVADFA